MNNYITYTWEGIIFSEVNLFITDILMSAVAVYCYHTLRSNPAKKNYALFFLLTGISAFGSAFGHLFTYYTDQYLKVLAWIFSLSANYFIIQASKNQLLNLSSRKMLSTFSVVKFTCVLVLLFYFQKFEVVSIDSIVSIALISLPIHFLKWKQSRLSGYKFFCLGILFTMATAIVGGFKLSVSDEWFNHKDINHLIISMGMLVMLKGIKRL
jgi:hypothetical protein